MTSPGYEQIHVIYPGGGQGTSEFDSLQPKELVKFHSSIPDISVFPTIKAGAKKTCIIIDDLEVFSFCSILDQIGFFGARFVPF